MPRAPVLAAQVRCYDESVAFIGHYSEQLLFETVLDTIDHDVVLLEPVAHAYTQSNVSRQTWSSSVLRTTTWMGAGCYRCSRSIGRPHTFPSSQFSRRLAKATSVAPLIAPTGRRPISVPLQSIDPEVIDANDTNSSARRVRRTRGIPCLWPGAGGRFEPVRSTRRRAREESRTHELA